jgi:hypothetical protein
MLAADYVILSKIKKQVSGNTDSSFLIEIQSFSILQRRFARRLQNAGGTGKMRMEGWGWMVGKGSSLFSFARIS